MKYSLAIRILHKILASLIIIQIILGFGFAKGVLTFNGVITLHKSFGLITFFTIVLLILFRIFSKKLTYNPPLPKIQFLLAKFVHLGIYVSSLGMALSGILGSMLMNYPWKIFFVIPFPQILKTNIPLGVKIFDYHYIFASALLILVIVHILAALYHQLIKKDNILSRII